MPILDNLKSLIASGKVHDAIQAIQTNNTLPISGDLFKEYLNWAKKEFIEFSASKDDFVDFLVKFTEILVPNMRRYKLDLRIAVHVMDVYMDDESNAELRAWLTLFFFRNPDLMQLFYSRHNPAPNIWNAIFDEVLDKGMSFDMMKAFAIFVLFEKNNLSFFKDIKARLEAHFPTQTFDTNNSVKEKIAKLESYPPELNDYLAQVNEERSVFFLLDHMRETKNYSVLWVYLKHIPNSLFDTIVELVNKLQHDEFFVFYQAIDQLAQAGGISGAELDKLCIHSLENYDINTYDAFLNIKQQHFPKLTQPRLSSDLNDRVVKLHSIAIQDRSNVHLLMKQLVQGLGNIKAPNSPNDLNSAALFVLAAIKQDKQSVYNYNPTIVDEDNLVEYLSAVNQITHPVSEKFIISSAHWNSGAIEIHDDKVNVLLIDPTGDPDKKYIQACLKVFHDKNITIYLGHNKDKQRQRAGVGCSVFALDDIRHLYTSFRDKSLFDYLASNANASKHVHDNAEDDIYSCDLPPSMQRTMQSHDAFLVADPNAFVNKKNETYHDSLNKTFVFYKEKNKFINQRLENKLRASAERVSAFIFRNGYQQAALLASQHTLQGFKNRISHPPISASYKAKWTEQLNLNDPTAGIKDHKAP